MVSDWLLPPHFFNDFTQQNTGVIFARAMTCVMFISDIYHPLLLFGSLYACMFCS